MMVFPVTSIPASAAALALIVLSMMVSLSRMKLDAAHGDAGDPGLLRRIRAQGNYVEYVPIGLILIGLAEACGVTAPILWALGGLLALGRLLHALGTFRGSTPLRAAGMIATYLSMLGASALLLYLALA